MSEENLNCIDTDYHGHAIYVTNKGTFRAYAGRPVGCTG